MSEKHINNNKKFDAIVREFTFEAHIYSLHTSIRWRFGHPYHFFKAWRSGLNTLNLTRMPLKSVAASVCSAAAACPHSRRRLGPCSQRTHACKQQQTHTWYPNGRTHASSNRPTAVPCKMWRPREQKRRPQGSNPCPRPMRALKPAPATSREENLSCLGNTFGSFNKSRTGRLASN